MVFKVSRTSDDVGEKSPCKGCGVVITKDDMGFPVKEWSIDIFDLDELMKFVRENGPIIIDETKMIEIYDAYRE